tara:strand:- start:2750 stop:3718 length:969 start_codon:yes stop_codon:yes gene_type:complete
MVSKFDLAAARAAASRMTALKPRLVVHGEPGIGKTTLGANAPGCVFIKTEAGCDALGVPALPAEGICEKWQDVLDAYDAILANPKGVEWIVLDSLNGAHQLCANLVCERDFGGEWVSQKGQAGYNAWAAGAKASVFEIRKLLAKADEARSAGIGIIMLGHTGLHKAGDAEGPDFYKYGMDMEGRSWNLVVQWADQVGHARREFVTGKRDGENRAKATMLNADRWLVFDGGPACDAKCRAGYDMPAKIILSWEEYESKMKGNSVEVLRGQALTLLAGASDNVRGLVSGRLEAKDAAAVKEKINTMPLQRVQTMVNWLLANKEG